MSEVTIINSPQVCNENYTGSFCFLHKLTPKFPVYIEALFSIEDYEIVTTMTWGLARVNRGKYLTIQREGGKILSRVLMGEPKGLFVDHINRNTMDNRRRNLRILTPKQSNINVGRHKNGTSRYKGVERIAGKKGSVKWKVQAGGRKGRIFLGHFATEIEAAMAYNEFAKREYGELACLNPV
jgi:hypothetical protein